MSAIIDLLRSFWRLFVWWFVVLPWEQSLRVRGGKHRQRFGPGLHFRVPYYDQVFKQSVRLRWTSLTSQTVTTRDGHTLTMSGQLGYEIVDIDKLYDTLHQAENAIRSIASGAAAKYVHGADLSACRPEDVERGAGALLDLAGYGLMYRGLQLTTFCRVKTYRFIMDHHENIWEDLLNTSADDYKAKPG